MVGLLATWSTCPGKKDGNVSLDCSQCRQTSQKTKWKRECELHAKSTCGLGRKDGNACGLFVASTRGPGKKNRNALNKLKRAFALLAEVTCEQRKTVETRGRVACHLVKRPRKERWKREFGLLAMPTCEPRKKWKREWWLDGNSTCGPGEKDGNACVDCLPRRQEAHARKMETHVRSACHADKGHRKKRWKRAFALFAVLPCKQRKQWKRVVGLLATWSSCPGKKDGNVSLDCSQCRQASPEKKMETRVWAACRVDMRRRKERRKRVCGLFVASARGP